jgi:cyclohexadieny/prephenate dehydrogenase
MSAPDRGAGPPVGRLCLIGVGLIGASLSLAAQRAGLVGEVVGCARSAATRAKALELGLAARMVEDPAAAAAGADLVMLCTPVGAYAEVAERIQGVLAEGAIVSDVGSVKQATIRDIGPYVPDGVHFVPGHPVAGTEKSGPEAGFAELFQQRWTILTPPAGTQEHAIETVEALWRGVGAYTERMSAAHHDRVLAMTSHLPHLIAYTIVSTAADLEPGEMQEVVKFSAGGFRDFTRIAASDPVMWRDIFLNNREAVLEVLQRFNEDITALQRAIRWGEGEFLHDRFLRTRELRGEVVRAHQAGSFDPREPERAGPAGDPATAPAVTAAAAPDPDTGGPRGT